MTEPTTPQLSEDAVREIETHRPLLTTAEYDALIRDWRAMRQWKAEALPLLTRYDNLAETFGGKLGSSKVTNLERGVATLREQLAEAESLATMRSDLIAAKAAHVDDLQSQLAQVTSERDALARGIADAAIKAGIVNGSTPLTGPHLLMLCEDLSKRPNSPLTESKE